MDWEKKLSWSAFKPSHMILGNMTCRTCCYNYPTQDMWTNNRAKFMPSGFDEDNKTNKTQSSESLWRFQASDELGQ